MSEGCAFFAHDMNDHRNPAGTLRGLFWSSFVLFISLNLKSPRCKCPNIKGRNLIVCIDGTSNQFGLKVCLLPLLSLHDTFILPSVEYERCRAL